MRLVVALGGNALLQRGEPLDVNHQRANVARAVSALATLAGDHDVIVTHGNGPQVGLLALQAAAYTDVAAYPLDVLGAESEGMVGFLIDEALSSALPDRQVATLLTLVEVDLADPAFAHPTKFIGPVYDEPTARRIAGERGWSIAADGPCWRRVVASPEPKRIREIDTIRLLADAGVVVVCAGGGGVPVVRAGGALRGVEAVIDKDLSAALLAEQVGADGLLLVTDADAVYEGWPGPDRHRIDSATPAEIRALALPAGSMGPKAEAAARFADATGGSAFIGALTDIDRMLAGEAGTVVRR